MNFIFFPFLAISLAACQIPPPTLSPTPIPKTTTTPLPTSTPTPTQTATPDSSLPAGPITELQAKLAESHDLQWNKDHNAIILVDVYTKKPVPQFQIAPKYAMWSRTYTFANPFGGIEKLITSGSVDELIENFDFSAWEVKDGQWSRKKALKDGQETDIPLYSVPEAKQVLLLETQEIKDANNGVLPDEYWKDNTNAHTRKIIRSGDIEMTQTSVKIQGEWFYIYFPFQGSAGISLRGKSDQLVTFYVLAAVGKDKEYAYLVWEDADGGRSGLMIDEANFLDNVDVPNPLRSLEFD